MLWSFVLLAHLASGFQARMDDGTIIRTDHVRGTDASMQAVIEEGCRRSPVFAGLVRDVDRSTYFVYVEGVATLRNGMRGALLHGTGAQYLRIHLKLDLPLYKQVAVLAHELQHVREIVQAGISADAAEMQSLFRRIGGNQLAAGDERQQFETAAALRAGDAVAADLRNRAGAVASVQSCRAGTQ
jgi:hypothetical protein